MVLHSAAICFVDSYLPAQWLTYSVNGLRPESEGAARCLYMYAFINSLHEMSAFATRPIESFVSDQSDWNTKRLLLPWQSHCTVLLTLSYAGSPDKRPTSFRLP